MASVVAETKDPETKMSKCPRMARENDEGHIEYKLKLTNIKPDRLQHLTTQLNYRLKEGGNEAIYHLGVSDNGTPTGISPAEMKETLETLETMCQNLRDTQKTVLRIRQGESGSDSQCCEVLVRQLSVNNCEKKEVRIATIGNVDSGKSTLIGVLTKGSLDNGRGSARSNVFRHRHEIESGRTSSVSQQILGFSTKGEITNYKTLRPANNKEIVNEASKVITFLDLAGHEAYLKTTIFGMTGGLIDYGMLLLGGNMGVQRMTREHLSIALALNTPLFVVVTKVDIAPAHVLKTNLKQMRAILKKGGRTPYKVRTLEDVLVASEQVQHKQIVPMFRVSNVTGEGLDLLKQFLNLLHGVRNAQLARSSPTEFFIDDTFTISGVGTVVAGTMYSGRVQVGDQLLLGPDFHGNWKRCLIKSIHCKGSPVESVGSGQSASFGLRKIGDKDKNKLQRESIRKGMVLVDPALKGSTREFEAEVLILHHPTTIKENYQPYCHIRTIRQSAKIIKMDGELLRTGDRSTCTFRFMYHPEYLSVGTTMLFREGRTKGLGKITKLFRVEKDKDLMDEGPTTDRETRKLKKAEKMGFTTPVDGESKRVKEEEKTEDV